MSLVAQLVGDNQVLEKTCLTRLEEKKNFEKNSRKEAWLKSRGDTKTTTSQHIYQPISTDIHLPRSFVRIFQNKYRTVDSK